MTNITTYIGLEKRDMDKILTQLSEFVDIRELTYKSAFTWQGSGMFSIEVTFNKRNGKVLEVGLKNNYDIKPKTITIRD